MYVITEDNLECNFEYLPTDSHTSSFSHHTWKYIK